jgi:hypothetical protein
VRLSRPLSRSEAGTIRSIKKFSDLIGNRTRDLPGRSLMTQLSTLQRAPFFVYTFKAWDLSLEIRTFFLSQQEIVESKNIAQN